MARAAAAHRPGGFERDEGQGRDALGSAGSGTGLMALGSRGARALAGPAHNKRVVVGENRPRRFYSRPARSTARAPRVMCAHVLLA